MNHATLVRSLTAIFLEPRGSLREAIVLGKQQLERAMPGQPYCSHPPHSTLLFGDYGPIGTWLDALRAATRAVPAFTVETTAWQLFPDDPLAGGGTTIAWRARLDAPLARLQRLVATTLAPHRPATTIAALAAHPLANREPFASSLRHYGFPFVGDHWIPHFTLGSPGVAAEAPLIGALTAGSPRHQFPLEAISVWSVTGEHHEPRAELPLGPQTH